MRITLFQYDLIWMDPVKNLQIIEDICKDLCGNTDLLVLPEMFNTGYIMSPADIPQGWQTMTIDKLQQICSTHNLSIAGSIPTSKNGQYFNTFISITAAGMVSSYDKIHLFTPAGEGKAYHPGDINEVFEIKDTIIMPLICYDLRFPYVSFDHLSKHVLIYSANWPTPRVHHWRSLLMARAIENQCIVIGVNRTGHDQNGYNYPGQSLAINFDGSILAELGSSADFTTISIDTADIDLYRKKLPFLDDVKK